MELPDVLQSDSVQKALIALLSVSTGVLATVIAQRIKMRDERSAAERDREIARGNAYLNVRRDSVLGEQDGYLSQTVTWRVNPSWIDQEGPRGPNIRGWEHMRLVHDTGTSLVSLSGWALDEAKRRHDWLVFTEFKGDELHFTHTEPFAPEDAHLFEVAKQ